MDTPLPSVSQSFGIPLDVYREMLNTLDAGFCVVEVLLEDGQPVDGIFRLTNPSFGRHLRLGSVVGKSLREVMFDD
ncbi:MAG TPA: PAS domain-containing sensor histidine kinase, partial [Xylella sp.]